MTLGGHHNSYRACRKSLLLCRSQLVAASLLSVGPIWVMCHIHWTIMNVIAHCLSLQQYAGEMIGRSSGLRYSIPYRSMSTHDGIMGEVDQRQIIPSHCDCWQGSP